MGRWVAIDYGNKRCGVAVTDPLKIIATPLTVLHSKELLDFLKDYHQKENIEKLVVGQPFRANGEHSDIEQHIVGFIRNFKKQNPGIPVERIDESYSSIRAMESMIASGSKKKDRKNKENIDKVSAAIILQMFMESNQK
jgi:putative Holliday junction resolvase